MDLKKYDELRKKINTKDFEGKNKSLDKWLYGFSFVGNFGSIFFAYFLVFPALFKAISINLVDGFWGTTLAFLFTNVFLVIFEIIKRYLVKNFSSDFVANKKKLSAGILGWFTVSVAIIILSFYLSLVGSKNLATTSGFKNTVAEAQITNVQDSLLFVFENKKQIYSEDNESLRKVNIDLRQKLAQTPLNYVTARKEYQTNIDKNISIINNNQIEIEKLDKQLQLNITELKSDLNSTKIDNRDEDSKNIILFIIIAIFIELIIIGGVYFREWYEYSLYSLNQQKFEKIYERKDRYRALLQFVYQDGKLNTGDRVISGLDLKAIVAEKTIIQNSNKFVDDFLHDMDRLGIFATVGKRRNIGVTFLEALNVIENYDDTYRILENIK